MSFPDPIVALSEAVVSGIAAGEVVERPASVVKELVENALDAGARMIAIEYDERPQLRIVVSDDGHGIATEHLDLAVARHATSKIRSLEDLTGVRTFGFRGEALASIAAVSNFELVSRTRAAEIGSAIRVRHGGRPQRVTAGARQGTRITVADLFANVPVRRKFLKSAATEYSMTADVIRRIALAEPGVHLRLSRNGRVVFDTPPVDGLDLRVAQVYGRDVAATMVPLGGSHGGMKVHGAVSLAGSSHGSTRRMSIFVNGRWLHDRALFRAVMEAYRTYLVKGRYPAVVIFLDVDPRVVDVNVHPAKREVRFSDGPVVERFLVEAIRESLRRRSGPLGRWGVTEHELRAASRGTAGGGGIRDWTGSSVVAESKRPVGQADLPEPSLPGYRLPAAAEPTDGRPAEAGEDVVSLLGSTRRPVVVGQVFDGYIVCQDGEDMLLVDQHALHERVLFERLTAAVAGGAVSSQRLLAPVAVVVGGEGVSAVTRLADDLREAGWEIDPFGEEEVVVRAVPSIVGSGDSRVLVERVVADLVTTASGPAESRVLERLLATVACHAAVRVGKRLDRTAAAALLDEARDVAFSACCPHGRPVARGLSRVQVERLFGR